MYIYMTSCFPHGDDGVGGRNRGGSSGGSVGIGVIVEGILLPLLGLSGSLNMEGRRKAGRQEGRKAGRKEGRKEGRK